MKRLLPLALIALMPLQALAADATGTAVVDAPAATASENAPAEKADSAPAVTVPAPDAGTPEDVIKPPADASAPANTAEVPAPNADTAGEATLTRKWEMVEKDSSITFHGTQMNAPFDGTVGKFTPVIYFDPDHLDQSHVTVTIDILSIDAQDTERNKNLLGPDWFDAPQFPTARFETTKFTKTGDNAYTADATLTIHGNAVPVQLPFTLDLSKSSSGKEKAVMNGKITLDRSKFALGQGDWADPGVIANEVPVEVKLVAISDAPKDASKAPEENKNKTDAPAKP